MNPRVEALVERAEQCHREVATEYYQAYAGLQERLDIAPIMGRYPELHSAETHSFVSDLGDGEIPDERYRRFLKITFTGFLMSDRLKDLTEQLANEESSATVNVEGEELSYRALSALQANEEDYARRQKLSDAHLGVVVTHNPLRQELMDRTQAVTRELGYANTIEMQRDLFGFRVHELAETCRKFLADTEDIYSDRLARYASEAGLAREQVRFADMGYILRGGRFDPLFPPADMVPSLARTLHGMGIELEDQRNVTLDLERRPRKTPRAFCIGISVPDDVRLVLAPRGGQDDYSILYHEAGHLEFAAHIDAALPYVYRQHGDLSVHESYAFLVQHLTCDPAWWREIMRADPGAYPAFAHFHRLYMLRRYCAKLNYEVEYYERGGGVELAATYAQWLDKALHVANPPERYLADFDSGLYVLQYLQAWIWEVQLRRYLQANFGEAWFTRRAAGDFLRELWRDGMMRDAWEIAGQLGFSGLDIAPLQEELTA